MTTWTFKFAPAAVARRTTSAGLHLTSLLVHGTTALSYGTSMQKPHEPMRTKLALPIPHYAPPTAAAPRLASTLSSNPSPHHSVRASTPACLHAHYSTGWTENRCPTWRLPSTGNEGAGRNLPGLYEWEEPRYLWPSSSIKTTNHLLHNTKTFTLHVHHHYSFAYLHKTEVNILMYNI